LPSAALRFMSDRNSRRGSYGGFQGLGFPAGPKTCRKIRARGSSGRAQRNPKRRGEEGQWRFRVFKSLDFLVGFRV
jgi:hypothetical protein